MSWDTTVRNSASIGSMSGEWKAWLTRSPFTFRPRDSSAATTCSTGSAAPESTTDAGPFTAAIPTCSRPSSSARTSSSDAATDTITPPPGRACISRPRAATSCAASASDQTPARWAAVTSPMEWPSRTSGTTP
ncbi:hypothetical protein GCM10010500_76810 [Streptomyces nigrescens]|nr:hypothetical protein GCM10010500_76810 [Streptomyces libani subsp. libani]